MRGPDPGARNEGLQRNLSWLRDPVFLLVMLATITQSFGYFVPILWLPSKPIINILVLLIPLSE